MFRDKIQDAIVRAIRTKFGNATIPNFSVETPEGPQHGDYATNVALALTATLEKKPIEIASALSEELKITDSGFSKIEVAVPGFINFWLSEKDLIKSLRDILKNPDRWGTSTKGDGKTTVVEYFQLNIAKPPHVGHLRSAIIGDAIKRMLLTFGYHAVSDTHVGDWGTQFGILLLQYKKLSEEQKRMFVADLSTSARVYTEASARIDKEPEERERAKEEFAKLEKGDPENRKIWEELVTNSMKELGKSAGRLKLLPFDEHRGESFYEDKMTPIVELALQKKIACVKEGAVIVNLGSEGLDEAVLIKSDGASTYLLRDLATIQYRKDHWNFWKNLYVVDVRQSHHFKQVFRVAELLGFEGVDESRHIEFGFMKLPDGPMSTRAGTAISLDLVLDEVRRRARAVIQEKNPALPDADRIAEVVGLGALKYFDLSHHRRSDIVFRWDEALSFEGNAGPYLQYTYARLKSILRKLNGEKQEDVTLTEIDALEHRLLAAALRFPEIIEDALSDFAPSILANYMYGVAKLTSEFYHSHPVMQESGEGKKQFRIALVSLVALTLKKGLLLLGIEAPEEM